jgi:flagellar L-ring protein precursor FlgH
MNDTALTKPRMTKRLTPLLLVPALASCSAIDRIGHIGEQPELTAITNPQGVPGYQPITMPMPAPQVAERQPNSLWRAGARTFFKDLRATRVGDIVTVTINVNDFGTWQNSTTRTRTTTENDSLGNFFGLQSKILPATVKNQLPSLASLSGSTVQTGTGQIARLEQVNLTLAAIVTQVLPNGNLVLHGRQELRVDYDVRDLQIAGIIRPEDITPQNTIAYNQIAEARISYGGRGQLMDVQQPRLGAQLLDIIMPF